MISITEARVIENFDVTQLYGVTFEVIGSSDPLDYKVLDTAALQDETIAEAYEGMMVRFENVHIIQPDAGLGAWTFSSDGTEENAVFGDDRSHAVPSDFNTRFAEGEIIDAMQGLWWFSSDAYKLVPETPEDVGQVTNVAAEGREQPGRFALEQNYPNPFNPSTSISFSVPSSEVRLEVFDALGRSVNVLVDGRLAAGTYDVTMDGTGLSSGVYIYRLSAGEKTDTKFMLLLK